MAEEKEPIINQPTIEAQKFYLSLINNDPEEVGIIHTNKKYKIRWLKNGQLEKLTRLLLHKRDVDETKSTSSDVMDAILEDAKLSCKAAAIIILDGYWKLKFRYWFLWRWFYYIKQYDNIQLSQIIEAGKKKVPQLQFYWNTMLLTEVKASLMKMRAEEAEATLPGRPTVERLQTASSGNGS